MDSQQASHHFKKAEALYQQGEYRQALDVLSQLNAQYPNSKNILYPMALSLENLGQIEQAEQVCERLIQLQHPHAERIKARLATKHVGAPDEFVMPDLGAMDTSAMDLMGDLDAPRPKRTVPQRKAASELPKQIAMGMAVLVAIAAIAGFVMMGVQKGWFKSNRETLESVEAKVVAFWDDLNSASAMVDGTVEMSPAPKTTMKITLKGSLESMKHEGNTLLRFDGTAGVSMPQMTMDSPVVLVCDGKDMFFEQTTMGVPMAVQGPLPPSVPLSGNMMQSVLQKLHEVANITLARAEVVDGEEAFVLEGKPKNEQQPPLPPAFGGKKLGIVKMQIAKSFSFIKLVAMDDAGGQIAVIELKNIMANASLNPSRFTYTPPAGMPMMKMEDLMKGMPRMPGM